MIDTLKLLVTKDKEFYTFLKKQLNVHPRNLRLYELAFLHKSASMALSDGSVVNNERLEFLGDAILSAVVADFLFRNFPNEREGFLTRMRSKIVNRAHLDSIATRMGIVDLVVSFAVTTKKKRICGDALEAMIGAMYLDRGYEKTHQYITGHILKNFIDLKQITLTETDFKSRLLEWGQKNKLEIGFELIGEHRDKPQSSPQFSVQATISGVPIAKGKAKSKKEAEQLASQKALTFITSSAESSVDALMQYLERMSDKKNNG